MSARWYIIQAHANMENKVAEGIREAALRRGLIDKFEEILVPTEQTVEVRRGKPVTVERKFFPGYIFAKMELTDETWSLVKNVPRVTGFLENAGKPMPLTERETQRMLGRLQEEAERPKAALPRYEIGQTVRVTEGPFASFAGTVEDIDPDKGRLTVSVSIFGRATNVDLDFAQVEKA